MPQEIRFLVRAPNLAITAFFINFKLIYNTFNARSYAVVFAITDQNLKTMLPQFSINFILYFT